MAYQIPNPISNGSSQFSVQQTQQFVSFGFPSMDIPPSELTQSSGIAPPSGFLESIYASVDAVKVNLINWFMTNKGERPMNPNFGANLRQYIFEALDSNTLEALEMKISDDIKNYFPMVTLLDVTALGDEEYNRIKLELYYYVSSFNTSDMLSIEFGGNQNLGGSDSSLGNYQDFNY